MASGFGRLGISHEELHALRDPAIDPTISGHLGSDFAQEVGGSQDHVQSLGDYEHKPTPDLDLQDFQTFFSLSGESGLQYPYPNSGAHEEPMYSAATHGLRQYDDPYLESSSSGSASRQSFDQAAENPFSMNAVGFSHTAEPSAPFDDLLLSDSPEEEKDEEDRPPVNGMGTLQMESAEGSPSNHPPPQSVANQPNGIAGVMVPNLDRVDTTISDTSSDSSVEGLYMPSGSNEVHRNHLHQQGQLQYPMNGYTYHPDYMTNGLHTQATFKNYSYPSHIEKIPNIPFWPAQSKYVELWNLSMRHMEIRASPGVRQQHPPILDVWCNRSTTRTETGITSRLEIRNLPDKFKKLHIPNDHLSVTQESKTVVPGPDALTVHLFVFSSSATTNPTTLERDVDRENRAMDLVTKEVERGKDDAPPPWHNALPQDPDYESKKALSFGDDGYGVRDGQFLKRPCTRCVRREATRHKRSKIGKGKENESDKDKVPEHLRASASEAAHRVATFNKKGSSLLDLQSPPSPSRHPAVQLMNAPVLDDEDEEYNAPVKGKQKAKKLLLPPVREGTVAVDFQMRIACYCRHQQDGESPCKSYQVVIALADHLGKVVAQTMLDTIVITDDHKDAKGKGKKGSSSPEQKPTKYQVPGQIIVKEESQLLPLQLPQSNSSPNLTIETGGYGMYPNAYQQAQQSISNHGLPYTGYIASATTTPNRSRPASPGLSNPAKRAKNCHAMWDSLTMTPLQAPAPPFDFAASNGKFNHPNPRMEGRQTNAAFRPKQNVSVGRSRQGGARTNPPSPPDGPSGSISHVNRSQSHDLIVGRAGVEYGFPLGGAMHSSISNPANYPSHAQAYPGPMPQQFVQTHVGGSSSHPNSQAGSRPNSRPASQQMNLSMQQHSQSRYDGIPGCITLRRITATSGSIRGGEKVYIDGAGFHPGLGVLFDNQPASSVEYRDHDLMICIVPHGSRLGAVPVEVYDTTQSLLPEINGRLHYTYVEEIQHHGAISVNTNNIQTPNGPSGFESADYGGYGFNVPLNQNAQYITNNHNHYSQYAQHRPTKEEHSREQASLPPTYEDATKDDGGKVTFDQEFLEAKKSELLAISEALADRIGEKFDSLQVESSNVAATRTMVAEASSSSIVRRRRHLTVESEEDQLDLLHRKREVKALKSDLKLWMVWIPLLVCAMAFLLSSYIPSPASLLHPVFEYLYELVLPRGEGAVLADPA